MAATSPEALAWASVPLQSLERHALSPRPREGQLGIGLVAESPARVGHPIRVAGFVCFSGRDLLLPTPWAMLLTFVASGPKLASGHWHGEGKPVVASPRFGGKAPSPSELTHRSTEYFTVELGEVLGEPVSAGRVYLYAFHGAHVSNVVALDVQEDATP